MEIRGWQGEAIRISMRHHRIPGSRIPAPRIPAPGIPAPGIPGTRIPAPRIPGSRIPGSRTALRLSVLALACALAGCVSDGGPVAGVSGAGPTVAFESIDGPPPPVFDRMVDVLDSEAKLRQLAVVSREAPAAYRVRSYLAAQVQRGKTSIAWVWDIYDRNQRRTLRLSGEEPAGSNKRDAWAGADDVVLRRIAQAGLTGLSGLIGGQPAAPQPAPAREETPPVTARDAVASAAPPSSEADALGFAAR